MSTRFNFYRIIDGFKIIILAIPLTLFILFASITLGLLAGTLLALIRNSRHRLSAGIAKSYIAAVRSTPELLLLFLIYYGMPQLIGGIFSVDLNGVDRSAWIILTFAINSSAYFAELLSSAYLSVETAQWQAAYSVGMTRLQSLRRIILPQVLMAFIPYLGNSIIYILKSTSLAYTIGIFDIMGKASQIIVNHYGLYKFETYVAVALVYWILSFMIEKLIFQIEKHYKKGLRTVAQGGNTI